MWKTEDKKLKNQKDTIYFPNIPKRYVIAFLAFTGITLEYCLKVNLSMAIVVMVRHDTDMSNTGQKDDRDTCPYKENSEVIQSAEEGEFEWDEEVQGYVLSSYFYGYICTQLLGGRMAERYGTKRVLGPAILITAILALLSPLVVKLHLCLFITIRILQGLASGVSIASIHVLVSKWFPPEERTKFSGIIFSAGSFGSLVCLTLSGILIDFGGWQLVFYFFGVISIIWCIPWFIFVYDSPELHPYITNEEKKYILSGLSSGKKQSLTQHPVSTPWKHILSSIPFWSAILMHFGVSWILSVFITHIPTYYKYILHIDIKNNGFISAFPHLLHLVSSISCGMLSQWLRKNNYISHINTYKLFNGFASLGPAIAFLMMSFVGCNTIVIVILLSTIMFLRGSFFGGSYTNHMDLAINFSGTLSGILLTCVNLAGILEPLVSGIIIKGQQTLRQWTFVFYISAGIVTVPYIIYCMFGSVEEQDWNDLEKSDTRVENNKNGKENTG